MGRAQKSTEKEGTPHGGALLIQTTELQPVARKLQNFSSRKRDDEKHRTE